jgi:hypothetical protein
MDWIREILRCHGQTVTICMESGDAVTQAFLQPVTERGEQTAALQSELGTVDDRLWLYLGKSAVKEKDCIRWNDMEFLVRSSRPYYIGKKPLYWWAALEEAKEGRIDE